MNDAPSAKSRGALLETLKKIVGEAFVLSAEKDVAFFASDVYRAGVLPGAVVKPGNREETAAIVRSAVAAGFAVTVRGGGLSYVDAYYPDRENTVVLDMRRLDRIVEINAEDMYVTVEAGCTWEKLYYALKEKGLRVPFYGPSTGRYATIGGGLSQNSMYNGCGQHGSAPDSVLAVQVVTADGTLLQTGSAATPIRPTPFFRSYGPDLTGLFLADAGALGVKVEATLRLMPYPAAQLAASFAFDDHRAFCRAMSEIGRQNLASMAFGFDRQHQEARMKRLALSEGAKALGNVISSDRSLLSGLKKGVSMVRHGRNFLEGVANSLHVVVEGRNEADAEWRMAEVRRIAAKEGREVANSIAVVAGATPFSEPTSMLGPDGERWVAVQGVASHSRAAGLIEKIEAYFAAIEARMDESGIRWSYFTQLSGVNAFFVQLSLYWEDRRMPFHDAYLGKDFVSKLKDFDDNPAARSLVDTMVRDLIDIYVRDGAAHTYIGRAYPYGTTRLGPTRDLLRAIKGHLDPHWLISPGALSLTDEHEPYPATARSRS